MCIIFLPLPGTAWTPPAPGHQTRWRGGNQAPPDSQLIANHWFSKIRLLILPLHIMNNSSKWEALSCAFGKTGTAQWELLHLNCTACFCHYCNLIFTPQFIASLFKGWGQQHWWAGYSYECHERKSKNMNILFCPSGRVQKRSAKAARATSGRGKQNTSPCLFSMLTCLRIRLCRWIIWLFVMSYIPPNRKSGTHLSIDATWTSLKKGLLCYL